MLLNSFRRYVGENYPDVAQTRATTGFAGGQQVFFGHLYEFLNV
jgi:hypothetical protein